MGTRHAIEQHLRRIRQVCPELRITSVRSIESGQYNDVLVADDRWIFRFPRFSEGVQGLARETSILRAIRGAITLATPYPVHTAFEPAVPGEVFAGYEMIKGEPLWRETLSRIDDTATLDRLAAQLGGFLMELHGLSPKARTLPGLPASDHSESWRSLYARIQEKLVPLMAPESGQRVRDHFERFLSGAARLKIEPVFVHGDLGGSNILFDSERGQLTGVIDFGSCRLGDPALDLAALATYGEPFLRRILSVYPAPETSIARIRFYLGTFALQEALYGLEHDDQEAFERGIDGYR